MEYINKAIEFMAFVGFSVMLGLYVWLLTTAFARLLVGLWDWVKGLFIKEGVDNYAPNK